MARPVTLVFGGWACVPEMLKNLFGREHCVYVDVNRLFPLLVKEKTLVPRAFQTVLEHIRSLVPLGVPLCCAGWSSGSLLATAIAPLLKPERLVLLSATMSFCRQKPAYSWGWKASTLQAMRAQLSSQREDVLKQFFVNAGLFEKAALEQVEMARIYSDDELNAGLIFLESYRMPLTLGNLHVRPLVFHGQADTVIPCEAGRALAENLQGFFKVLPGGHLFYRHDQNVLVIKDQIEQYFLTGEIVP